MAKPMIAVLLFFLPFGAHAQILPDSPKPKLESPHKFNRKLFWTGTALLAASTAADLTTTAVSTGRPENNPAFGRYPSNARITAVGAGYFAAQTAVLYFTERSSHRWVRWGGRAFATVVIVNHAQLATCNATSSRWHTCRSPL